MAAKSLRAIADVLDGFGRLESARKVGVAPSSMTNWIHRFNARGIEGLASQFSGPRGDPNAQVAHRDETPDALRREAERPLGKVAKRRLRGVAALKEGAKLRDVADAASVGELAVKGWIALYATDGVKGLVYGESKRA